VPNPTTNHHAIRWRKEVVAVADLLLRRPAVERLSTRTREWLLSPVRNPTSLIEVAFEGSIIVDLWEMFLLPVGHEIGRFVED
jgi:hypothetical protein